MPVTVANPKSQTPNGSCASGWILKSEICFGAWDWDFSLHSSKEPPPPGSGGRGAFIRRFLQPMGNRRRHRRVERVMAQHLLNVGELSRGMLLSVVPAR